MLSKKRFFSQQKTKLHHNLKKGYPLDYDQTTRILSLPMTLYSQLSHQLIVSCQADQNSPLHNPEIISTIALACVRHGVQGLRIDTPSHITAVRSKLPHIPIIGLWKQQNLGSSVYITPRYRDAEAVAKAGADIIAIDATARTRPDGETLANLIQRIKGELNIPIMADIDTFDNGLRAWELGVDFIGTTLYGYTDETKQNTPPGFNLLSELVQNVSIPVICEGGVSNPTMAQKALELGAFAVVVGTAITGIDQLVQCYLNALKP